MANNASEQQRATRVVVDDGQIKPNAVAAKIRPRLSEAAYASKLLALGKDSEGREVPDPTPMELPIGYVEPPSIVQLIRKMIRDHEIEKGLGDGEFESFDEADDFDVGDENAEELRSGFENDFEPPEVDNVRKRVVSEQAKGKASKKPKEGVGDPSS